MEFLQYHFMQRALAAGLLIGVACAILGVFLVLRRDAMVGHGLAHVTFGGIAVGLFLSVSPLWSALAVAAAASLGLLWLREKAGLHGDTAIGIVSSAGFAAGIILVSVSGRFSAELMGYLFGNILAIGPEEVWISGVLALGVVAAVTLNYSDLVSVTFAPELARASGLAMRRLDALVVLLSSVTVVLAMKVVGLLLVSAMLVIPAASGLMLASTFRSAILLSCLWAVLSVAGGMAASYHLDLPASGTVVSLSVLFFLLSWIAARVTGRRA